MKNIKIVNKGFKKKEEIFSFVADELKKENDLINVDDVIKGFVNREKQSSTGFENGFAIPHTKVKNLKESNIFIIRDLSLEWPSMDGKNTEVAIAIVVGEEGGDEHLKILSTLARKLMNEDFQTLLKKGKEVDIINELNENKKEETSTNKKELIIGVTACTTGIAHTYMAAESLEKKAKELGYDVKIETRGQSGVSNELTKDDIKRAKGVIVAVDVDVPLNRFNGKKLVEVKVKDGIHKAEELINSIDNVEPFKANNFEEEKEEGVSIYKALMNGVTYMLPFVVVGGIFTALRFLFGTEADIAAGVQPIIENIALGNFFGNIGGILFSMMLPVLAGYIAFAIGNRAALMPGFLAGLMASNQGSGFLGALVGGFVAGYVAKYLFSLLKKVPKSLQGSYQILFLPILGALIIGIFMMIFGIPIKFINETLTNTLVAIEDFSPLLLGFIIGAMMASDMGGPINKAAYVTGTLLLAEGNQTFMAAVMAGGMVPPLAIALSTIMYKNKYSEDEKEAGKTNWIMGLSFVTEGAIPFAAANPKRVIPALMVASGVASALSMVFKVTLPAPHGGIFVFPLIGHVWLYVLSIVVGTVIGAILLGIFKENK